MTERTTRISRELIQNDWAERGFSCELWVEAPGTVLSDFVHDTEELILLLDGTLVVEMDRRVLRLEPGEELLIPAGMRHTLRNVDAGTTRWLYGYRLAD